VPRSILSSPYWFLPPVRNTSPFFGIFCFQDSSIETSFRNISETQFGYKTRLLSFWQRTKLHSYQHHHNSWCFLLRFEEFSFLVAKPDVCCLGLTKVSGTFAIRVRVITPSRTCSSFKGTQGVSKSEQLMRL
jgi:hypothetical protein